MSVILRRNIQKNLDVITKQIGSISDNTELKSLENRLAAEKDEFVRLAITERLERMKKAKEVPNPYADHKKELTTLKGQLEAALKSMEGIPWYMETTRGKKAGKGKKK